MAELFPTPASAVAAMTAAGWTVIPAEDLLDPGERTIIACLQGVQLDDGTIACAPTVVIVRRDGDEWHLTGRTSGREVTGWAYAAGASPANPEPLLLYIESEIVELTTDDPRAQDRMHDGMPADPFGGDPGHAAVATDAIELKTMLDTYIEAGFTRAEAFELVLAHHQTELDHAAQHCLVEHQYQREHGGDQ